MFDCVRSLVERHPNSNGTNVGSNPTGRANRWGCSSMAERAAYNRLTQVRFLTPLPTLNC